jgi:hypothetical protein
MFLSFRSPFGQLMCRAMTFIAVVVVARFVLELVGVPPDVTRFVSSSTGVLFVALYVAAVAPLRGGMQKFSQLLLPALVLSVWMVALVMVMTVIAAVLHLQRSHYAMAADMGNWGHLGRHLMGHTVEMGVFFGIILLLMAAVHFLWRWPITVAPGALLGAIVIMRAWTEVMGLEPLRTAAWSSTLVVFLSAFYLGGIGPRVGLTAPRALLVPSLVLAWTWRFWVYLATVLAALAHFKTHFFDPTLGRVGPRLLGALVGSVVEGAIVGLIVWGIAVWIAGATRQEPAPQTEVK